MTRRQWIFALVVAGLAITLTTLALTGVFSSHTSCRTTSDQAQADEKQNFSVGTTGARQNATPSPPVVPVWKVAHTQTIPWQDAPSLGIAAGMADHQTVWLGAPYEHYGYGRVMACSPAGITDTFDFSYVGTNEQHAGAALIPPFVIAPEFQNYGAVFEVIPPEIQHVTMEEKNRNHFEIVHVYADADFLYVTERHVGHQRINVRQRFPPHAHVTLLEDQVDGEDLFGNSVTSDSQHLVVLDPADNMVYLYQKPSLQRINQWKLTTDEEPDFGAQLGPFQNHMWSVSLHGAVHLFEKDQLVFTLHEHPHGGTFEHAHTLWRDKLLVASDTRVFCYRWVGSALLWEQTLDVHATHLLATETGVVAVQRAEAETQNCQIYWLEFGT